MQNLLRDERGRPCVNGVQLPGQPFFHLCVPGLVRYTRCGRTWYTCADARWLRTDDALCPDCEKSLLTAILQE